MCKVVLAHCDTSSVYAWGGDYSARHIVWPTFPRSAGKLHFNKETGVQFWWGVGTPGASAAKQTGSWAYVILPLIEQSTAYQSIAVESAGSLFACPSRSRQATLPPVEDAYGIYSAGGRSWAKIDYAGNRKVFREYGDPLPVAGVFDGLSQTIAICEKAFDPVIQGGSSWYFDEGLFAGGNMGTVRDGLLIEPDRHGISFERNWGSAHPGGAVFSRLDGSTSFLTGEIDFRLLRAVLSPAGHEVSEQEP